MCIVILIKQSNLWVQNCVSCKNMMGLPVALLSAGNGLRYLCIMIEWQCLFDNFHQSSALITNPWVFLCLTSAWECVYQTLYFCFWFYHKYYKSFCFLKTLRICRLKKDLFMKIKIFKMTFRSFLGEIFGISHCELQAKFESLCAVHAPGHIF